jgi:hypothetical protein
VLVAGAFGAGFIDWSAPAGQAGEPARSGTCAARRSRARAGFNLLVSPTSERASQAAYRALMATGRSHPAWRTRLEESARRIRTLKTR